MIQCSTKPQIIKEEEEVVLRRRVQEYWSFRVKGEWDKSYTYESPEYRERVNLQRYFNEKGRFILKWVGFNILEIWASGEEGYVKLNIKYRYLIPEAQGKGVFQRIVEEKWIKKDGNWYHISI